MRPGAEISKQPKAILEHLGSQFFGYMVEHPVKNRIAYLL